MGTVLGGMNVNDRRKNLHVPKPEDYETPVTKSSLVRANRRFRETGIPGAVPPSNREAAAKLVSRVTRERFKNRHESSKDFGSIGEYLEYLNEAGKDERG